MYLDKREAITKQMNYTLQFNSKQVENFQFYLLKCDSTANSFRRYYRKKLH